MPIIDNEVSSVVFKITNECPKRIFDKLNYNIIFTSNWFVKLYKFGNATYEKELQDIEAQAQWNREKQNLNSFTFFHRINHDRTLFGLVVEKIPLKYNLEKLLIESLSPIAKREFHFLISSLKNQQSNYDSNFSQLSTVFFEHKTNFLKQISYNEPNLSSKTIDKLHFYLKKNLKDVKEILSTRSERDMIRICHGDTFSSNIFLTPDKVFFIDPGYELFKKRIDILAEYAMIYADVLLLSNKASINNYEVVLNDFFQGFKSNPLFKFYLILKILVRIRHSIMNKDCSIINKNVASIIETRKETIFKDIELI